MAANLPLGKFLITEGRKARNNTLAVLSQEGTEVDLSLEMLEL